MPDPASPPATGFPPPAAPTVAAAPGAGREFFHAPRLTGQGAAFLLLTALAGFLAFLLGSQYILLLFSLCAATLAAAGLHARLLLRGLRAVRTLGHPIFSHSSFQVTLRLSNDGLFPLTALRLVDAPRAGEHVRAASPPSLYLPLVPGRGEAEVRYMGRMFGRGRAEWDRVVVETEAPFGLFRGRVELDCASSALVYPRAVALPARLRLDALVSPSEVEVAAVHRGAEELVGLREFRPGDNPRWIHWRTSGRVPGQLLVRDFATPSTRRVLLVVDSRRLPLGARAMERRLGAAASLAASLALELLRVGSGFTLIAAAPQPLALDVTQDSRSLWEALEVLALLEPSDGLGVSELLAVLPASQCEGATVLAVTTQRHPHPPADHPDAVFFPAERPYRPAEARPPAAASATATAARRAAPRPGPRRPRRQE
ncbi:MAG: DUF58 domain-containing protein [Planctomycetes bacterium]|nr:DUF58 domain-containing protein [Planctomycetota bacterium]